jgi:signal transduction histidine kinase
MTDRRGKNGRLHEAATGPRRWRMSRWEAADLRQWGIRPKLIALLLIPTLAALLLGGLGMQSALSTGAAYARVERLASAAQQASAVVHGLQAERDLTEGFLVGGRRPGRPELGVASAGVDRAVADLRTSLSEMHDAPLPAEIRATASGLDRLGGLRKRAGSAPTQPAATQPTATQPTAVFRDYSKIIESLSALPGEIAAASDDSGLANQAVALESLALVKESTARQRALLYGALTAGGFRGSAHQELVAARAQRAAGVAGFLAHAPATARERFQSSVGGPGVGRVEQAVGTALDTRATDALGMDASQWFSVATRQIDLIRQVESSQIDSILGQVRDLRSAARNTALTSALLICLILGFALLATLVVARSMIRPLQALRSTALDVAHRRLPDTVQSLQESDGHDAALLVPPGHDDAHEDAHEDARDEIGQVARAFDAVHSQAVRLAGEQALMRGKVSAMFVNLSRRSQALVERQLRLIDELETGEQDPDRLASLFKLDHLATRMRRNDENLLVLAGAQGGRKRTEPVPLVDVIRAASAEVEQYSRVQIDVPPRYELAGAAVNDAVHLIAELLENATVFSSPETPVRVSAHGLGERGEVMIEIEDHGIGMAEEELTRANEKLAEPAVLDVSMSRMMGLFVVARLAQRQGIHARLQPAPSGGVTALVRLPSSIVLASFRPDPGARRRPVPGPSPRPVLETSHPPEPRHDELDLLASEPASLVASLPGAEEAEETERSPIFDALRSAWFQRLPDVGQGVHLGDDAGPAPGTEDADRPAAIWDSPGDEGWRAAAAITTPPVGGVTSAGLPVRVPGRNLVPGSAAPPPAADRVSPRSPEGARALSGYQQGIVRARRAQENGERDRPESPEEPR